MLQTHSVSSLWLLKQALLPPVDPTYTRWVRYRIHSARTKGVGHNMFGDFLSMVGPLVSIMKDIVDRWGLSYPDRALVGNVLSSFSIERGAPDRHFETALDDLPYVGACGLSGANIRYIPGDGEKTGLDTEAMCAALSAYATRDPSANEDALHYFSTRHISSDDRQNEYCYIGPIKGSHDDFKRVPGVTDFSRSYFWGARERVTSLARFSSTVVGSSGLGVTPLHCILTSLLYLPLERFDDIPDEFVHMATIFLVHDAVRERRGSHARLIGFQDVLKRQGLEQYIDLYTQWGEANLRKEISDPWLRDRLIPTWKQAVHDRMHIK